MIANTQKKKRAAITVASLWQDLYYALKTDPPAQAPYLGNLISKNRVLGGGSGTLHSPPHFSRCRHKGNSFRVTDILEMQVAGK